MLDDSRRRINGVPASMQELHDEYTKTKALIDECEATASQAEVEQRAAEGSASESVTKAAHYQDQIARVTTQREYGALLSEIDTAKKLAAEFEDQALESIEIVENANTERDRLKQEFEETDQKYQTELAKWEKEKPKVAKLIDRLDGEAEVLRAKLPKSLLLRYQRLYDRHSGHPLAKIEPVQSAGPANWRCSACNYSIRPQVVVQLRAANELVSCGCGRQLYLDPVDE